MGDNSCWKCHRLDKELHDWPTGLRSAIVFDQGKQIEVKLCPKCIKELGAGRIEVSPFSGIGADFRLGWGNEEHPDEPDLEIELFDIAEERKVQERLKKGKGATQIIFFLRDEDLEVLYAAANAFKRARLQEIKEQEG